MVQRLLWLEMVAETVIAVALLAFPTLTIRALGLPGADQTFWPRVLGGVLIGLAFATLAGGMAWTQSGLGLGGHIAINVATAFVLFSMLALGPAVPSRRGRFAVWITAISQTLLALVEIAYAV